MGGFYVVVVGKRLGLCGKAGPSRVRTGTARLRYGVWWGEGVNGVQVLETGGGLWRKQRPLPSLVPACSVMKLCCQQDHLSSALA